MNAQVLIAVGITLFCINIIATVFSGKIAAGLEKTEQADDDRHSSKSDEGDKGRADFLTLQDMPGTTRWVSVLGISSWFPKRSRRLVPAVSVVVIGVFVNAFVQLIGNTGLYTQLATGFSYFQIFSQTGC